MRISDWSSDVCSSDLNFRHQSAPPVIGSPPAPWSSNQRPDLESSILRQLFFAEGFGERLPHRARTPSASIATKAINIRLLISASLILRPPARRHSRGYGVRFQGGNA